MLIVTPLSLILENTTTTYKGDEKRKDGNRFTEMLKTDNLILLKNRPKYYGSIVFYIFRSGSKLCFKLTKHYLKQEYGR